MFWGWIWKLHIFHGVKMSSTWFCMVGPWHSVTGVQIFRRKWKLLHWSWGSDVIPLYRPTAREINLMTNSQICRFYVFSFAKCKIDGMASKELFPLNIRHILPSLCLIHKKEGYQKLELMTNEFSAGYLEAWGLLVRIITKNIEFLSLLLCV